MAGGDIIMMSAKELRRANIISQVLEGKLRQVEAADVLGLTDRQIRRIVRRVTEEGDKGICHRSRGRPSNRQISGQIKDEVIEAYRERYSGFGPTLASEKLMEVEGIEISDETLRIWLKEAGITYRTRKRRPHRQWRERKGRFGEMIQLDGSQHDWLEGRGAKMVLMGFIDDATGEVFGRFHEYEGTIPAMDSFKRYIRQYGLPASVYLDKHTTYKSTGKATIEDELAGLKPMSQFERALKELGVKLIHAHSPQAKGRIERLFGTFQDRLVKEMRLLGIKTLGEANECLEGYLPVYNQRFQVPAAHEGDLHSPVEGTGDLDRILCIRNKRTVRKDTTITHNKKLYQIEESIVSKKVAVEEWTDGSLHIVDKGRDLRYRQITKRPVRVEEKPKKVSKVRRTKKPDVNHLWRQQIRGVMRQKGEPVSKR